MSAVAVHAAVAERGVRLDLDLPAGQVTAVVGPNGSGKTTLLHLISGLARPTSGAVQLGDTVVAGPGVMTPVHRRRVALLTQRPALFPHLDVRDNVAFGPRAAGFSAADARSRATQELAAVGCLEFAGRRPHELSGGQAQRVAIARALATDPEVVLLDEPLASLDVRTAAQVRRTLGERLKGRTALLVTHEPLDIWMVADRVAVIVGGRVVEDGPIAETMARPTSDFLAQLSGITVLPGVALDRTTIDLGEGVHLHGLSDPDQPLVPGEPGLANIAPTAVSVHLTDPGGSPRNVLPARVVDLEPRGDVVRVGLTVARRPLAADLTPSAVAELGLHPGMTVRAAVKATQVRLYGVGQVRAGTG